MTKIIKINSFYLETVLRSRFASVLIIYGLFWMEDCSKFKTNV